MKVQITVEILKCASRSAIAHNPSNANADITFPIYNSLYGIQTGKRRRHDQPLTALIMSNMGRYMAMSVPPITVARTTMMIGSMTLVRVSTAAFTSSS